MASETSTAQVAGGGASFDHRTTRISGKVRNSYQNGKMITVTTQVFGAANPAGTHPMGPDAIGYFDIKIVGIDDGIAWACITPDSPKQGRKMRYWKGGNWVDAQNVTVKGMTVCGDIPVPDLAGTAIVIGT
ncbi:MAG: hypothetical protein HY296_03270 [Thaumarchaeota archaeon]|nr:hypothetical protein [Nitrososphaerota archaeon]